MGYHNDALLSSLNDSGTYVDPYYDRAGELEWVNDITNTTPFSGETTLVSEYTDPENTLNELDQLNAQTLNIDYHPNVLQSWKDTAVEGVNTYKYISDHLGYRFVIQEMRIDPLIKAGEALYFELDIINQGFGNLLSHRSVEYILANDSTEYVFTANENPSDWDSSNGTITLSFELETPTEISNGNWRLYINIPSPYENLEDNAAHSIRFANENTWDQNTGYNLICSDITVINGTP